MQEDVQAFILSSVRSVWSLELLLVLHRGAMREWGVDELVRETRASSSSVQEGLAMLTRAGLVAACAVGRFVYLPASTELAGLADRLVQAYVETPMAVIRTILSTPDERIRTFSEAFIIRRKD